MNGRRVVSSVAIVETNVLGALAYHPQCLTCGWVGRRHDLESRAVHAARAHGAKCPGKPQQEGKQ